VALAGIAAIIVGLIQNFDVRSVEAYLVAGLARPFLPGDTHAARDVIWITGKDIHGLEITTECTALLILVPLTAVALILLAATRLPWWRFIGGLASMIAAVIITNTFRVAVICWASEVWGISGYDLTHLYIGSMIGVIGFAAGAGILVLWVGKRRNRKLKPALGPVTDSRAGSK